MHHVLQGLDCGDVYIDDIIIGSSGATEEELLANHTRNVRAVLDRLRKEELVASVSKTNFFPCVRATGYCRARARCALQNYSVQHSARYGSGSWVCKPMS